MDIVKKAISHEEKTVFFFNKLNNSIYNRYLNKLFNFFIKESKKHNITLQNIVNQKEYHLIYSDIYGIRKEFTDHMDNLSSNKNNRLILFLINEAINKKKESQKFYLKKANELQDENIKKIFLGFADDEYNHFFLLEFILKSINITDNQYQNNYQNKKIKSRKKEKIKQIYY